MRNRRAFDVLAALALAGCSDTQQVVAPPELPSLASAAARDRDYVPRDLGTLGGTWSITNDINDRGQVVGASDYPFLWSESTGMVPLSTLGASANAAEINDHGVIVGWASDAADGLVTRAVLWTPDGQIQRLPIPGQFSLGVSINNAGDITGCYGRSANEGRPFVWTRREGFRDLGTFGGQWGCGESINKHGDVVGYSTRRDGKRGAFIWTAREGMRDLGSLAGGEPYAFAINDRREVVGWEDNIPPWGTIRGFIWTAEDGFTGLGAFPGSETAMPRAINNRGEVVGHSHSGTEKHVFLWTRAGGMRDLGLAPGQTFSLGWGINNRGDIVGEADVPGSIAHAVLWTPRK